MDWLWVVGYFVVGIVAGVFAYRAWFSDDNDISDVMMTGCIVLMWPAVILIVSVIGLGQIVKLLGKATERSHK